MRRLVCEAISKSLLLVTTCMVIMPLLGQHIPTQAQVYHCSLAAYYDALDSGFSRVTGRVSESAISVRIESADRPETELILDKTVRPNSVLYLRYKLRLWSLLTHFHAPPDHSQCLSVAKDASIEAYSVPVPNDTIEELIRTFHSIDLSPDNCVRNRSGKCVRINDATTYEVYTRDGKLRARVTDIAGPYLVSENPALLGWIHQLLDTVRSAKHEVSPQ